MLAAELLRKHIVNYERKIIELEGERQNASLNINKEGFRLRIEHIEMQILEHREAIEELNQHA